MVKNRPQILESELSPPLQQRKIWHFVGKLLDQKRACAICAKAGRKRKEGQGCTFKTLYACEQVWHSFVSPNAGWKVLLRWMAQLNFVEIRRHNFSFIACILAIFIIMQSCLLRSTSLVDHCSQMNPTDFSQGARAQIFAKWCTPWYKILTFITDKVDHLSFQKWMLDLPKLLHNILRGSFIGTLSGKRMFHFYRPWYSTLGLYTLRKWYFYHSFGKKPMNT